MLLVAGPDMDGHAWNVGPAARSYVAAQQLESSVRFLGSIADVAPLLRAADIAIQPSHFEALGLSAIEALASGVPVVASAVGGLLDFVVDGENGKLCPPEHPDALAAAIRALVSDAGLRRPPGRQRASLGARRLRRGARVRSVRPPASTAGRGAQVIAATLKRRFPILLNSGYAAITDGSAVLLLALLTIAGRALSPEDYGRFGFALALTTDCRNDHGHRARTGDGSRGCARQDGRRANCCATCSG